MLVESRYSCQIKLPAFGHKAQAKLRGAKVLIVGAGGLGCPAAQYLASAGIGRLDMADFDRVSRTNLHRQILFGDANVGEYKVIAAARCLGRQNPEVHISPLPIRVTADNAVELATTYDVVVDCTDNYEARYLLNDACVLADKPLVYGAAYQYQGQVAVWNVRNDDGTASPHYRDIFPAGDTANEADCASGGVIPTLTGIIGCLQANEVIKYLAGLPGLLSARLLLFDALTMQTHVINLPPVSTTKISRIAPDVPTISAKALRVALPHQTYELVDVRSSHEHAGFNIGGTLMPLEMVLSGKMELTTDKPVVFYCKSGRRSAAAVRHVMRENPGLSVLSLEGGVQAWQLEAEPIYG